MKKLFYWFIICSLVLAVSSCKRNKVDDPTWDDPSGYNVLLEGSANPAVLFIDSVIHASQISVAVTDINGNPLAGKTILFEQYDANYAQVAWGYFENTLATIEKVTDSAGRAFATFYGPTSLMSTQMFVRALMVINGHSYGDNPPQDFISLSLCRNNYKNLGPAVTITAPADGASVNDSVAISANIIDEDGVAQVACYIDGSLLDSIDGSTTSDTYAFTWDSAMYTEGNHKIKIIAYDTQGKKGQDDITVNVSGNNPVVTITAPAANAVVNGSVSITAVATDASNNIQTVECYVDSDLIQTAAGSTTSSTYSFTWDSTLYSDGNHRIKVIATDAQGKKGQDEVIVSVSGNNPVVTITAPASNAVVNGSVSITAVATSVSNNIQTVACYIDGSLLDSAAGTTSTTYSFTWNSALVSDGIHTIKVIATDTQGKKGEDAVTVTVSGNNLSPVVHITSPAPDAAVTGSVSILALATDVADGIQTVACYIDGNLIGQLAGSTSSDTYTFSWDTTQYSNGFRTITVTAIDNAGMSGSASITVRVDNTMTDNPPTTTLVYPVAATSITLPSGTTSITILANADDDHGITHVDLYVNDVYQGRCRANGRNYRYVYTVPASGTYKFYVIAYDTINQKIMSNIADTVVITLTP